ncbi:glutaredoxin family protein [Pseudomonas sp. GX19020]|uniref:glutaredoxin domain-containing protein n=1 Tax=Pseudomonas sp. GX19020 TaxID=2942277 RepID=UPI002019B9B9|nr:glutaredoxin family protein [Pseudomonas sp. GX19020]
MGCEVITLYSRPTCVQCDATKRALDQAGLQYRVIDLTEDAEAMGYVQSLGYRQAPVVVTDDGLPLEMLDLVDNTFQPASCDLDPSFGSP